MPIYYAPRAAAAADTGQSLIKGFFHSSTDFAWYTLALEVVLRHCIQRVQYQFLPNLVFPPPNALLGVIQEPLNNRVHWARHAPHHRLGHSGSAPLVCSRRRWSVAPWS